MASTVFINELHYDNAGDDVGEFIEIAGPAATNLDGWAILLYNGSNGLQYNFFDLTGITIDDEGSGFGAVSIDLPAGAIQNGLDGVVLVDASGEILQFLSYEGTFTATGGPANRLVSTDIGVAEDNTTPVGQSLQLVGTGTIGEEFTFAGPADDSPGDLNVGQTLVPGTFDLQVTEVWPGQNGPDVTADWFEITNTGTAAWVAGTDPNLFYEDESANPGVAAPIEGLTQIDVGEAAIVVIGTADNATAFTEVWGAAIDLTGVEVGSADGANLSGAGDTVTLFVGDQAAETVIDSEAYPDTAGFDGLSYDVGLAAFSTAGQNGAVATQALGGSGGDVPAVGSPGNNETASTPPTVPTVPAFTLELLHVADQEAGSAAVVDAPNLSAVLNALREQDLGEDGQPDNTLTLSSGDAFIPGVFFDSSAAAFGAGGIADIQIQNELGFQAIALGNHEFDFGTRPLSELITGLDVTDDSEDDFVDTVPESIGQILGAEFQGAQFPYLSANLDFSTDEFLAPLEVAGGQAPEANSVTSSVVIDVNGENVGVVGATTPTLGSISSPGGVGIAPSPFDSNPTPEQLDALAAEIQAEVDALLAADDSLNKVILLAHFQQIEIEFAIAERLENVDIIVAGGSNTRLFDENDRPRDGDSVQGEYPTFIDNAGGTQTAVVNTDGSYRYVGRLVLDFDADGNIIADSYDPDVSGAFATDAQGVTDLGAEGLVDPEVQAIADAIEAEIIATESNVFGLSDVFLNGNRSGTFTPDDPDGVRTQETNLGNLTADANLVVAQASDETVVASVKNGGGIRASIGETIVPAGGTDAVRSPNQELVDSDGNVIKPEGGISQNDIATTLAFNNGLTLLTLTREELVAVLEHGVAALPEVAGQFPQIAGIKFSYNQDADEGSQVQNAVIEDEAGNIVAELVRDGAIAGDPAEEFRIVTLDFLAAPRFDDTGAFIGGGDGYPFPNTNADPGVGEVGDPDVIARVNSISLVQEGVQTGDATFADDGTEQDALAEFLDDTFATEPFTEADTGPAGDERIQNLAFRADTIFGAAAGGAVTIPEIQGAGHISPFVGQAVETTGIVTAVDSNGFYLQDPAGDGDDATSDGIFVFTNDGPAVAAGDEIAIAATVSEFIPGGADTNNLSITQLGGELTVDVVSSGNELPAPVILGSNGRVVPDAVVISEDELPVNLQEVPGTFNPEVDGIDFFESLEGLRVTIDDPAAVSATNGFGETWTVTDDGANVSSGSPDGGLNDRGGINLNADPDGFGDLNPERVQIQFDSGLLPEGFEAPGITAGDDLSDVTGVVNYAFGNFEVAVTEPFEIETPSSNTPEVTALTATADQLTIATYNILNVTSAAAVEGETTDPDAEQRAVLASQIVDNLGAPDIVALQEIQDNNGAEDPDNVGNVPVSDATETLQDLVEAIVAAGGPEYAFFDPFSEGTVTEADGTAPQGGIPSGNIRNAFLYDPSRVELNSIEALTPAVLEAAGVSEPQAFNDFDGDPATDGTRIPLVGNFTFQGEEITVINNHLSSRFGSSPIFGGLQPFIQAAEDAREMQTQALNDYVDFLLGSQSLTSDLSGDQEILTVSEGVFEPIDTESPATAAAELTLNEAGDALSYSLTFSPELDFSAAVESAAGDQTLAPGNPPEGAAANVVSGLHFHAGTAAVNGPVVFGILGPFHDDDDLSVVTNDDGTTTVSGVWEESDPEGEALSTFLESFQNAEPGEDIPLYFNLHTAGFPGGEIRGQIQGAEAAAAENIVVLGDLNTFEFTDDLTENLPGVGDEQVLTNLVTDVLPGDEASTFIFQGNSQVLDHIFVTDGLLDIAEADVVHVNNDFVDFASDHEPVLTRLNFGDPAPGQTVIGGSGPDQIVAGTGDFVGAGIGDTFITGAGADEIDFSLVDPATVGDNLVLAGSDDDTVFVSQGDIVVGGSDDDTFFTSTAGGGNRIAGGAGNDAFFIEGSGDRLLGNAGDDTFTVSGGGDNVLSGGAGSDIFRLVDDAGAPSAANTITDFAAGTDVIEIAASAFSADDLTLGGEDIALGGNAIATLLGVDTASLAVGTDIIFS